MLKHENPVLVRRAAVGVLLYTAGSIALKDDLGLRHVPALLGGVVVFGGLAWLILTVRDARHPEPATEVAAAASPPAPGYETLVRSRVNVRVMRWMIFMYAAICVVMLPVVESNWPWLLAAGTIVAAGIRFGRMGVLVGPQGIRVIGLLRSKRFSWAEVDHFTLGGRSGVAHLHLANGRTRTIAGVLGSKRAMRPYSDDAVEEVAELNRLAKLYKEGHGTSSARER